MNIYVYSDESGVLDKQHRQYYVFGGLMFLSKEDRDISSRKYIAVEKIIRQRDKLPSDLEVKAATVSISLKRKLFRALNQVEKFGIVIEQQKLLDSVFSAKKTKQRYLDWAYKMAVKNKLESLISQGIVKPAEVKNLIFYVDEHTTATDGRYELRESIEQEFRYGVHNWDYSIYYPPILPNLTDVQLRYCDSRTQVLIRGADIVANMLYHMAVENDFSDCNRRHFDIMTHP